MNETNEYTNYLKDVIFINEDDDYKKLNEIDDLMLKNDIMKNSFSSDDLDVSDIDYFKNAYEVISQNIPKTNKKTDQWKSCVNDCYNNIENYMKNEMESTSYMLRVLTASILGNTSDYKIVFLIKFDNSQSYKNEIKDPNCYVDSPVDMIDKNKKNRGICYYTTKNIKGNPFTGKWKDDAHFFNIGIMKNDKLLQTQNKKKETYLEIHIPKNNSTVIDNTIRELEQMEREYINTISPLQSPFYKSLWGEKEYSNVMNDINKKITRLPYLKYKNDRVLKPRDKNIQDANKIIELLKLMKAFKNYTLVEQSLGIPRKDEEDGNYYISSGVLYNGRDTGFDLDPNQKRGLPSDGSLFNRKQQDLYDLGINVNISQKLSDEEYRKIILDLIEALRKIKKNDNFDYNEINGNPTSDVSKIQIGEIPPNPFLKETYPTIEYTDESNGRFILGAGPSASGKTYNAGLVVKMMKMVNPSFPEFFMTIDGGTYRDVSVIYQSIIRAILEKSQYPGLKNLMSASIFSMEKTIFESDSIKKNIKEYLLKQTRQYNFIVSLYVPDTLAFCGSLDCMNKIIPYIEITGDNNWIGLMIYQHKNGGNSCPFKSGYKCKGCTESGKEREKKEGKKYSSSAWEKSMTNGFISIKNAPNIRIVYHNNGGVTDSKSVFEDLSSEKIPYDTNQNIKDFFDKNNVVYIGGELKNSSDCHEYLLTGCSDTYFQDQITRLNLFKEKKEDNIAQTVPTDLNNIKLEFDQTNKNMIPSDVSMVDKDFLEYYNHKYIGIPSELNDSDDANNDDIINIQSLIQSGYLVLSDVDKEFMDDEDKKYIYYHVIINPPFDPNKNNDYENIKKLILNNKVKLYDAYEEKESDKMMTKLEDRNIAGLVETPVVETPVVETPVVETPIVETPVVETPIVEKPVVETPIVETPVIEKPDDTSSNIVEKIPVIPVPSFIPPPPSPIDVDEFKDIQTIVIPGDIDIGMILPEKKSTTNYKFPSLKSILTTITSALPSLNISFSKNKEQINKDISEVEKDVVHVENQIVDNKPVTVVSIKVTDPKTSEKVNEIIDTGSVLDITKIYNKKISDDNFSYQNLLKEFTTTGPKNVDIVPVVHGVIAKLLDYCKNKYIAIPKHLGDDDKKIVNNLEWNGYIRKILDNQLDPSNLNEKDKMYDYYEITLDDKIKEIIQQFYDDLQKLSVLNNIIVYERSDETPSSEATNNIVSPASVKKSNISNLLNVFKDVNNVSANDFFSSLGSISKHVITGSKTQKNKGNGIPVNVGPACNLSKKNNTSKGIFSNMFGAGKKKRTRKNKTNAKKTQKNKKGKV